MTSLNLRPRRIEVPLDVRRALARLGRTTSIRLFGISDFNYVEAVSPNGRIQEKTVEKIRTMLSALDDDECLDLTPIRKANSQ